jgi:ketosteroid isomerase-like protein
MTGIDAVRQKHEWWDANNEVHSVQVNGPFLGEDQFAVQFTFDSTFKPSGQRRRMKEMALYTVKDGRIVREEFFYNPNA